MAPPTRNTNRQTLLIALEWYEIATTTKRQRYFDALNREGEMKTLKRIALDCNLTEKKARRWRKQRALYGTQAVHRTRRLSTKLGRRSKVNAKTCRMLVDPRRNPIRTES